MAERRRDVRRRLRGQRTKYFTSPLFVDNRIFGAILFENSMDREIEGQRTAYYYWGNENVVPFLKVDKGLANIVNGVQVMNPMTDASVSPTTGSGRSKEVL